MGTIAEEHQAYETPPRNGGTIAITLDSTSRSYDTIALAMGGPDAPQATGRRKEVFVTVSAEGTDAFISFSQTGQTIDDTAKVAAGGTLAYATTYCAKIVKDGTPRRFRLDRVLDRFMNLKAVSAGSGVVRIYVSSPESP